MKIRSRLLTKLLAVAAVLLMRALFGTCRFRLREETPGINGYISTGARRFLYCVWHDQLLMTIFSDRPQRTAGLVSGHQDGSYLADAMKLVGIRAVRGSTNRGGDRALRQLMEATRDWHIAITPDGPRGPRRQVESGIVFLASRTGRPIVPAAYVCRRSWNIRGSWTDMLLPQPFTEIACLLGRPLAVPPNLDRAGLDRYADLLKAEMDRLESVLSGQSLPALQANIAA